MQVSLGRSAADEIKPGLYKISKVNISYEACNFLLEVSGTKHFGSYLSVYSFSFCVEILDFSLPICLKKRLKGKQYIFFILSSNCFSSLAAKNITAEGKGKFCNCLRLDP